MDPSFDPAAGMVDTAGAGVESNLPDILLIVGVLIVTGIVIGLIKRFVPGA